MPQRSSFSNKQLEDFVGPDTYRLFDLPLNDEFLKVPVSYWPELPDFQHIVSVVKNLSVVNDCAKRALSNGNIFTWFYNAKK